ncbi:hypothetical protein ACL2XP_12865 [Sodalis sp. RH21]
MKGTFLSLGVIIAQMTRLAIKNEGTPLTARGAMGVIPRGAGGCGPALAE